MKRITKIGVSGLSLILAFSAGAYAATAVPKIIVNGNQVKTTTQAKIIDGSVYVPIRAISEGLDANIQWDNKSKTVYVDSDPNFKMETDAISYVLVRNMAYQWIMAYDERDQQRVLDLVTPDFDTDIYYTDSFPAGTYNLATIVDMKVVARSDYSLTARIVQRVTAVDEYKVKVEQWKFTFEQNKIKSVKIVPKSAKFYDRYTLFPGTSFGI
jgi:hypothetical protein